MALHAQDAFSGVRCCHLGPIGQRHRRHVADQMGIGGWLGYSVRLMAGGAIDGVVCGVGDGGGAVHPGDETGAGVAAYAGRIAHRIPRGYGVHGIGPRSGLDVVRRFVVALAAGARIGRYRNRNHVATVVGMLAARPVAVLALNVRHVLQGSRHG